MSRTWTASMIAPDEDFDGAPLLRGEITLDDGHGSVTRATLHASSQGVFEAWVGGHRTDDDVLSPGWSSYEWRLRYRSYDVTSQVGASGATVVVALALGNGWFRGQLGFLGNRAVYGKELAGIAELEVEFEDGHRQIAGTDQSWRSGPSEVVENDLYGGETIDARRRDDAWLRAGAVLDGWSGVHVLAFDSGKLTEYVGPAVHRQETRAPQRIWTSPAGRTLVDFGQNLVGWVKLTARGQAGDVVTLRHAEVLEKDELGTRPLRTAAATDRFVLSGGEDVFEPTFTFHGFRYVEVDGYPGELSPEAIEAVIVHSDLDRIGTFECSDPLLNRLHENVVWSQRGNFLDLPTDCPQRDERLGWTGDIAVFAPTAAYLFDVSGFLDEWLANLDCEQRNANGLVAFVVPDNLKYDPQPKMFPKTESTAIWSDAAAWVPWALWQAYGDLDALARHYPAMVAHARRVESLLSPSGLWDQGFQFGDWLDPTAPPEAPFQAKADNGVVATACYVHTLGLVARTARLLGKPDEADSFQALRTRVLTAFREHYVRADGVVHSDCPTVYALAIVFDLLDDATRALAGRRLADLARENGYRIATGFAGTPYVLDALSATGHLDVAYRLLTERECPSWLYTVGMGGTTIWERWDSMLPDGTINPGEMTSFNHYALGAVADWMHRTIAGINPLEPGYARVLLAPQPGAGLTHAKGTLHTPHGVVTSAWRLDDGTLTLDVDVPEVFTSVVRLGGVEHDAAAGHHQFTSPYTAARS